jgi:hypothetical protein
MKTKKNNTAAIIASIFLIIIFIFIIYSTRLVSPINKIDSAILDKQELSAIFDVNTDENIQITSLSFMNYLKRSFLVLEIETSDLDYFKQINPHIKVYNKLGIYNIFFPSKRYKPLSESFNIFYRNNTVYISVYTNELQFTNKEGLDYLYSLFHNY